MTTRTESKQKSEQITGVSNIAFNLLTILENKLQGISAMEEYRVDFRDRGDQAALSLIDDIQRREIEDVEKLKGYLKDRL